MDKVIEVGTENISYVKLEGENIILMPFNAEEDSQELYENTSGEHDTVWRYMPYGPFKSAQEFQQVMYKLSLPETTLTYTVIDKKRKIGMVNYLGIHIPNRVVEIGGIFYSPSFHQTYANRETSFLLIDHAISKNGFRRVEWKCDSRNEPSKNAALKLGFTFEGIFRQHMVVKGVNRDSRWFSILDSEWENELKQKHIEQFEKYKKMK